MSTKEKQRFELDYEAGCAQVAGFWTSSDGTPQERSAFCQEYFCETPQQRATLFLKLSRVIKNVESRLLQLERRCRIPLETTLEEFAPIDKLIAAYLPSAHMVEDLYESKVAFAILLNFPQFTLEEKRSLGSTWSDYQWAQVRLVDTVGLRRPRTLIQAKLQHAVKAERYIEKLAVMSSALDVAHSDVKTSVKLRSHWDLRDELVRSLSESATLQNAGAEDEALRYCQQLWKALGCFSVGILPAKNTRKTLAGVASEVDLPGTISDPFKPPKGALERRFRSLHKMLKLEKSLSKQCLPSGSFLLREFEEKHGISSARVEQLAVKILENPLLIQTGQFLRKRIGRQLRPFDIWNPALRETRSEETFRWEPISGNSARESLQRLLPKLLRNLSFDENLISQIAQRIELQSGRADAHAILGGLKDPKVYLRLPNIEGNQVGAQLFHDFLHELGHCTELLIAELYVDYLPLRGSCNSSVSEAFAFQFEQRAYSALSGSADAGYRVSALASLWDCFESAGASLVELRVYKDFEQVDISSSAELGALFVEHAHQVWDEYFAPVVGSTAFPILSVFTHYLYCPLYIPNYFIGQLLSFAMDAHFQDKVFGAEFTRMCKIGKLPFSQWTIRALGAELDTELLFEQVARELQQ